MHLFKLLASTTKVTPSKMMKTNRINNCKFSSKNKLEIQTLSEIYEFNQKEFETNIIDKLKNQQSPSEIYLHIVRAIKQNLFLDPQNKKVILDKISAYSENRDYSKHIISILLPINYQFPELNEIYVSLCINYLKMTQKPSFQDLFYMICNLERNVFDSFLEWGDQHWLVRDYSAEHTLCKLMMNSIVSRSEQFEVNFILRFMKVCSILNFYLPEYSLMLIELLHNPNTRLKLKETLQILSYLSDTKSFPYEFFYPRKRIWINIISTYPKFSTKKSMSTLKYLEIMIKQNPPHCEQILAKIIELMEENTLSLDDQQISRQWYSMSKAKFIFPQSLLTKMLYKINQSIANMQFRQLCLLVRAFARFEGRQGFPEQVSIILDKINQRLPENRLYEKQIIRVISNENKKTRTLDSLDYIHRIDSYSLIQYRKNIGDKNKKIEAYIFYKLLIKTQLIGNQ